MNLDILKKFKKGDKVLFTLSGVFYKAEFIEHLSEDEVLVKTFKSKQRIDETGYLSLNYNYEKFEVISPKTIITNEQKINTLEEYFSIESDIRKTENILEVLRSNSRRLQAKLI